MSDQPVGATAFFAQRRTILTVLSIPAAVILIVVSTILFGTNSHRLHTGSVAALENAATEYLRLQGVDVAHVEVAGSVSTVDQYWGEFLAQPTTTAEAQRFQSAYGFARFEHSTYTAPGGTQVISTYGWVVVAIGTADVGCAGPASTRVPASVLAGFRATCSASVGHS